MSDCFSGIRIQGYSNILSHVGSEKIKQFSWIIGNYLSVLANLLDRIGKLLDGRFINFDATVWPSSDANQLY